MDVSSFLSLPEGLHIASTQAEGDVLTIHLVATASTAACPLCTQAATRVHSRYTRQVTDVPCGGRQVRFILHVRKFRCDTAACPRRIFAERLTPFLTPWARMTSRQTCAIQAIGLATCGEGGARLAERLAMPTSPTTVLRRVMALPFRPVEQVRFLGVDDFSFRRGHRFGTLLVDLTDHQVLDLLPDRSAETTAVWMLAHPEIELVSRDRGEDYATAARTGAPQARQVADRFHLAQNLTKQVEEMLSRCWGKIRQAATPSATSVATQVTGDDLKPPPSPDAWPSMSDRSASSAHLAHHAERSDRYHHMVELRQAGLTCKEIARRLGMGERTVRYWLTRGIPYGKPELRQKPHCRFDPYAAYVTDRWEQGCHNALQLWREITLQGFKGGCSSVYRHVASLRDPSMLVRGKAERSQTVPEGPLQHLHAREAVWLFVREPATLDEAEQATLKLIRQASPTADQGYQVAQEFLRMLRQRKGERLDAWLEQVRASQIPELQRFGQSLERDKAAVLAGLTLPYSNGVVEGKVNKLKLIKRMMYGRAGFALLRQRVVQAI